MTVDANSYIDLFAGCGGLSLGLQRAGWKGLFAVEKDPMAFETIQANMLREDAPYHDFSQWPSWLPKEPLDIKAVLETYGPQLSRLSGLPLVAGGPPCQGFSVGGIRDGRDQRNTLVEHLLEVVQLVKPKLALVENVEGISKRFVAKPGSVEKSVADYVVNRLGDLGYSASHHVVAASDFGVPQTRRRVLILGVRGDLDRGNNLSELLPMAIAAARTPLLRQYGLPLDRPVSAWEALHDLSGDARVVCPDSPKFDAGTYIRAESAYAKAMRCGLPDGSVPDSHRFTKHGDRIKRLYEDAHATQPPGRLSKKFLLSWGTKKDKKVLLDPEAPSSTITTHPDEFIHYKTPRNITVREMARLQSFPDDFEFKGRYTINGPRRRHDVARCSQVGNAVPPLLAAAIGMALASLSAIAHATGPSVPTAIAQLQASSERSDTLAEELAA